MCLCLFGQWVWLVAVTPGAGCPVVLLVVVLVLVLVVVLVALEMPGELGDSCRQQCHLDLRGSTVGLMALVLTDHRARGSERVRD